MNRHSVRFFVLPAFALIVFILLGAGLPINAQTPAQTPASLAPQTAPTQTFTADQLNDLVAPIALYPDPILTQVLVASTYPLEVVEAQQWLQQNHTLSGTQLMDAARQQGWDPSVQALVAFPDVLKRLNQDIRWTTDVGNAFLAQQADVMAAVQRLRASAQANGRLKSTPQQTVSTVTQGGQPVIVIQPANPDVVYVPSYDPAYIWGPSAWGSYPSLDYPAIGFGWGAGIDLGFWGGWGDWGWGPDWFGGTVFVNNVFFHRHGFDRDRDREFHGDRDHGSNRERWAHDPGHRLGVPYPNRQLAGRFQAASAASRANLGASAGRHSLSQPNGSNGNMSQGARPGAQQFGSRPGMPGNGAQGLRGPSPQGGAARMAPQGPSFGQPAPNIGRSFGSGGMRGFGGGLSPAPRGFGGGGGFGGGHGFGGGFGGRGGGFGGGHGGGGHR